MTEFEARLSQSDLSFPDNKGENLFIAQVSVGLSPKFKQLPYHNTQRPVSCNMKGKKWLKLLKSSTSDRLG